MESSSQLGNREGKKSRSKRLRRPLKHTLPNGVIEVISLVAETIQIDQEEDTSDS